MKIARFPVVILLLAMVSGVPDRSAEATIVGRWTKACAQTLAKMGRNRWVQRLTVVTTASIAGCATVEQCSIPAHHAKTERYQDANLGKGAVKMALIGDSISTGFEAVEGKVWQVWEARKKPRQGNWFFDEKDPDSFFQRLKAEHEFYNFARPGSAVDGPGTNYQNTLRNTWILKLADMGAQVDAVLELDPFPNIVVVEVGSNNHDIIKDVRDAPGLLPTGYDVIADPDGLVKKHVAEAPGQILGAYEFQLRRLIERARKEPYPKAIVLMTIPNFQSYFKSLDKIAEIRKTDPSQFATADEVYGHFESFRPDHRGRVLQVREAVNRGYENLVNGFNSRLPDDRVRLFLDNTLARLDLSSPSLYKSDGFHPGPKLNRKIAEDFGRNLQPVLKFIRAE